MRRSMQAALLVYHDCAVHAEVSVVVDGREHGLDVDLTDVPDCVEMSHACQTLVGTCRGRAVCRPCLCDSERDALYCVMLPPLCRCELVYLIL